MLINCNIRIVILILLLCLFPHVLYAQIDRASHSIFSASGFQNSTGKKIIFQQQPQNFDYKAIRCILKDHKGLMWFGTQNGLIKYDGINLTAYEHIPDSTNSLSHIAVTTIIEDSDNNLWIGTAKGLNLYNRDQDNFSGIDTAIIEAELINESYINELHADSCLWIGTLGQGLLSYNTSTKKIVKYDFALENSNTLYYPGVTAIQEDGDVLWIGTQNGLYLFAKNASTFKPFHNSPDIANSLSSNLISSIQKDKFGQIWIGTEDKGINLMIKKNGAVSFKAYNTNSEHFKLSGNYILSLFADDDGFLWIGTENDGLNKLNINSGKVEVFKNTEGDEKSINGNSVWEIYEDNENRIWFGSYNKGVSVIDNNISRIESYKQNVNTVPGLLNNDVRGFAETKDGKIWIATDGGGICRFNLQKRSFDKVIQGNKGAFRLTNNSEQSILSDKNNNLWIGSWGGGVDLLTSEGEFVQNFKLGTNQGTGNNRVRTLLEDKKGNIWAGTNGSGLFIYSKISNQFEALEYENMLNQKSFINAMVADKRNNIWIGIQDGLVKLTYNLQDNKLEAQKITRNIADLNNQTIVSLFIDSKENLWVGTAYRGLMMLDLNGKKHNIIKKENGLASDKVIGILEDNSGNIWLSTNAGISKISKTTHQIKNFTKDDGFNSNDFYSKSCLKSRDGALLFGSENGFNLFYPEDIITNTNLPEILFTDFKIDNISVKQGFENSPLKKHISETEILELDYYQSSFSIDFVALNYTRPHKNEFCYQLEGYDKEWNCIGNKRTANYTKVKPGKYIFKVKCSNNDGVWNNEPKTLKIIIKPPFWLTWWAYSIYIVILSLLIILSFRAYQERLRIKNQLEFEKLAKEKEHELNERNISFFTNISHEFRTPLSLITGPLESLITKSPKNIKEQLLVMQRNANRLLALTNNLMDLRKLEEGAMMLQISEDDILEHIHAIAEYFKVRFKRMSINFSIETESSEIIGWFDKEKLTTILINLLSNAIKYTPNGGYIKVVVRQIQSPVEKNLSAKYYKGQLFITRKLEVDVIDSGVGIKPEALPFIFDKFYHSSSEKKGENFGTGIGLALTKGLVEMHRGEIGVESKPNSETKFTFQIPVNKEAFHIEEYSFKKDADYKQDVLIDEPIDLEENKNEEKLVKEFKEEVSTILIVEDNDDLRAFLVKELSRKYSTLQAADGFEGVNQAAEQLPDLIISDIMMPNKNGIELCNEIKSNVKTSHIPVILLTAKTSIQDQIEGINKGADAYVTKPFNLALLLTQIENIIHSRRELYAQFSQNAYIRPNKLAGNDVDREFLQKTIDFVLHNITDTKLSVASIAELHNMSHSVIYKKIKALTGNTIIEFIKIVRLKEALKLMESKKYSLAEISYMTGFTSPSYFTKNFREQYGKPPSEYLNK